MFDLVFNDGDLRENPESARREVEALTELMKSPKPIIYFAVHHPLRYAYQSIWFLALSEIPMSGEKIDAQVMLYVQGCEDAILGNLNWKYGP